MILSKAKWLHLLRNDEVSVLTPRVYTETSEENHYQEFCAIGEVFLYDQQVQLFLFKIKPVQA